MKPVFPIEKSKSLVELQAHGKPTLVASDASGIRYLPLAYVLVLIYSYPTNGCTIEVVKVSTVH